VNAVQSVLIRSTAGGFEPRIIFAQRLLEETIGYVSRITWLRSSQDEAFLGKNSDNVFRLQAAYGRGWKNTFSHFLFFFFVLRRLHSLKPKVIYACDLDTLLPALVWSANKKVIIVFDQYDPFSARTKNNFMQWMINKFEYFITKKADIKIAANRSRVPQNKRETWYEIKNIYPVSIPSTTTKKTAPPLVILYGGILSIDRGLVACAEAISQEPDWEFHLYGQGLMSSVLNARNFHNVFVYAPVPHDQLIQLASESSLYLATYDPARAHNRATASNKLFEAAQLGVPLLTSKGTEIGREAESFNLGWSVTYNSISEIRAVLKEFSVNSTAIGDTLSGNLNSYYESNLEESRLEVSKVKSRIKYLLGDQM
jgi:glycosyltransferase involved in cell wall biosynthesis